MKTPSPLIAGEPVREGWSRELVDFARSNAIRSGARGVVRRGAGGTTATPSQAVASRPSFSSMAFGSLMSGSSLVLFKGGVLLAIACVGSVIYVRKGTVSWGHVVMPVTVDGDDFGPIWDDDNYIYVDAGETPWAGVRHAYVHVGLKTQVAYLKLSASADLPTDDPVASIVRWPLASIAWTGAAEDTNRVTSVVETWHVGHIKIPCVYGPPL